MTAIFRYNPVGAPNQPVKYEFLSRTSDTMELIPIDRDQDPRLCFTISNLMNCFVPSGSVTTVRRGNDYIGDFE
jgi:hypothetical protein